MGAGIIGLAVARELLARQPDRTVTVLEREPVTGFHQTGHNSGVLHAGIYYAPGSLKARLCTEGAPRAARVLRGARDPGAPGRQADRRARRRRGPAARRARAPRPRQRRPRPQAPAPRGDRRDRAARHAASTRCTPPPPRSSTSAPWREAFADDVEAAGGEVVTGCAVEGADLRANRLCVRHAQGESRARFAVFCAGGWSDRLAVAAGGDPDPRIVPFRGAWLRLQARAPRPRARARLPGARPRAAVPRRPLHPRHRRRGAGRPDRAAGRRARRLQPQRLVRRATCARRWPGPAPTGWRAGGGAPACSELRHAVSRRALVDGRRPLHPRADARRRPPRPRRRARPGARPRR